MAINVVVFIIPLIVTQWLEPLHQFGALNGYWIFEKDEPYRFLSSMFLHSGLMHIVMNVLSLYLIGKILERLFTPSAYIAIYFITGIFGSLIYIYISPFEWAVGASGAIFGMFGALAGFAWIHRKRMHDEFMQFMRGFGIVLLLNLVMGLVMPQIAMSAHIGGLVAGIISGVIMAKNPKYLWGYLIGSFILIVLICSYLSSLYASY